jgi:hypothetical protein
MARVVLPLVIATAAALQPSTVPQRHAAAPRPRVFATMSLPDAAVGPQPLQVAAASAAATLLADADGGLGSVFGALKDVGTGVLLIAFVAIPLYYIYGVFILSPEEREEQGIGKLLADLTYAYTPSPWRKSYLAGTEEELEPREPLDLPEWASDEARLVTEPECVVGVKAMQRTQLTLPSLKAPLDVCYWSAQPDEASRVDAPPVILIHGFDSSVLEFRFVLPKLVEAGLEARLARVPTRPLPHPVAGITSHHMHMSMYM